MFLIINLNKSFNFILIESKTNNKQNVLTKKMKKLNDLPNITNLLHSKYSTSLQRLQHIREQKYKKKKLSSKKNHTKNVSIANHYSLLTIYWWTVKQTEESLTISCYMLRSDLENIFFLLLKEMKWRKDLTLN